MSVSNVPQKTINLLWGLAGGHCELCGKNVTIDYLAGQQGKFAQVAHIEADSPGGPRYNQDQTNAKRNAIENLMLVCPTCHKEIDSNAEGFSVGYLQSRKKSYEESVKAAVDAIGPVCADIVALAMTVGSNKMTISEKECKKALVEAGVNAGDAHFFDAFKGVPDGCGPDSLNVLKKRIITYHEVIHSDKARRTALFAIAPQPVLIGLGTMFAEDGSVDIYQRRRDIDGWAWAVEGQANEFFLEPKISCFSEDCTLVISVSGDVDRCTFEEVVSVDRQTRYELHAARTGPTAIMLKDDLYAFRRAVTESIFRIHEKHSEIKRLHVIPAMPVSACVAFGMAWNRNLIPELVIYEKTDGTFKRALTIGGPNEFGE